MQQPFIARAGRLVPVLALLLLAACDEGDGGSPLAPEAVGPAQSVAGLSGFYFLSPIAEPVSFAGTFDPSLPVTVQVCAGVQTPCAAGDVVASYSTLAASAQEQVRVDLEEEAYLATWSTRGAELDPAQTYRIHVLVGTVELGHADVDVIRTAAERRAVPSGFVPLVNGQTLPIRFRIEVGVIAAKVIGSEGGEVTTSDGGVTLAFPEGALEDGTVITVQSASNAPDPDGRLIGGTAYEFGPHGAQFSEPVTVTINYDAASLPAGVSPRLLRLYTYENDQWVLVEGSNVDPATQTISGQTTHFSTYAGLPASFAQVEAGEMHVCALTETGSAWCWGKNDVGQLGTTTVSTSSNIAVEVQVPAGITFVDLGVGGFHSCGLTSAADGGNVYCWGRNINGQLGDGTFTNSTAPVLVGGGYSEVDAGWMHTCAITSAGDVDCWGSNRQGQLGTTTPEACSYTDWNGNVHTTQCSNTPVRTGSLPAVVEVASGLQHTCARTSGGAAYCWGWNVFGQLGDGTKTSSLVPVQVSGGSYAALAPGALHSCAIGDTGQAYCWGDKGIGNALGDGLGVSSPSPVLVQGGYSWTDLAASEGNNWWTHTCGVVSGGAAYCWGANDVGQLGSSPTETCTWTRRDGTTYTLSCSSAPAAVAPELQLSFREVVTGLSTTCGFTTGGDLYCWGRNDVGQLGNGTWTNTTTPTKVATSTTTTSTTSASRVTGIAPSFNRSSRLQASGAVERRIVP